MRPILSGRGAAQSGWLLYELFALLLLRLPPVFTFHALFELPRFADRSLRLTAPHIAYTPWYAYRPGCP